MRILAFTCVPSPAASITAAIVAAGVAVTEALAQDDASVEEIVIEVTPLDSPAGLSRDRIAYNVQSALASEMENTQSLHVADFLNRRMQSVSINDAQNNPLQPDLQYRGFTASPLLGLAQGLAVYQNGVRINEPLGDTVNWDLLPPTAIRSLHLIGGANPLFGLNTLGGALSVDMKSGFDAQGHRLHLQAGDFGRRVLSAESGGVRDGFAWYANAHHFEESGWRDLSPSDATNVYASVGWQREYSRVNLNGQFGQSDLVGNGAVPLELLQLDRRAIFTAPDITENRMHMVSLDGNHELGENVTMSGNLFYRRNRTGAFNGDGSELAVCTIGSADTLLEGLERDDLEEIALDRAEICGNRFATALALQQFLNDTATALGEELEFDIDDIGGSLSGVGALADAAVNNRSTRLQETRGGDLQFAFAQELAGRPVQSIVGAAWFRGSSTFDAVVELAGLDPVTRSTDGLGTGTYLDDAATSVATTSDTSSLYATTTIDLDDRTTLTLSGRMNRTSTELKDRSGEQPELNGRHLFTRFNPALGLTYRFSDSLNVYAGYSESSRPPTPIELACNDRVFELAEEYALARGDDPGEIDFECRLPNAFLADPPLEQVVARSFEAGLRWESGEARHHLGLFRTTNHDDILFQTTGRATGLFANVDETRRQGIESGFSGSAWNVDWFMTYSYIEATFRDGFDALSPNHPAAGDDGTIAVRPGDRIPGIPTHHLKAGADWRPDDAFSLSFGVLHNSGQHLRGDEANQLAGTGAYTIMQLRGRYRVNDHVEMFAGIDNLLDTDYETFGLIGDDPREVDVPAFQAFSDVRFFGPGAPRAAFLGLKLTL